MSKQSRRNFLKKTGLGMMALPSFHELAAAISPVVYLTTGFKISEVTDRSAIFWTRLCRQEAPVPIRHKRREEVFRHPIGFDENQPVEEMDGAVAGAAGFVRVTLLGDGIQTFRSDWHAAIADDDYTVRITIDNLESNTSYHIEVEARASMNGTSNYAKGSFRTAPDPQTAAAVCLVACTCQYFWSYDDEERGFRVYDSMRQLRPDFYAHTGDYVYYDKPGPLATTREKARHKWHAMNSRPSIRDFCREVPIYMLKDDHDLLKNDVDPTAQPYGELSYTDGLKVWQEQVQLRDKPYRTYRWGKDLQIWLIESREYRSNNDMPDGPGKTIWGGEQIAWFKETIGASNATFKLLISPTPIVGPDRDTKKDNHANRNFQTEGTWLRQYLSTIDRLFIVSGDRHWQYVSEDPGTGLMEFGSGPVSDFHAQGWKPDDIRPEHRFLRVKGGFLQVRVYRKDGNPYIQFDHCDVDGKIVNTYSQYAHS
ncbi:alkaline phosphatase D family protein [Parapedobacter soli]|uniref:alkaline phosphatase D family protein n=1 Tax=Parapedobacter soli TaxID=416955 RepID=UPI0021C97554|nr:alkaline phosphatase D family protein [Parapedobacter soli]